MWVRVCTGFGFGFGVFLRAEAGISPRQATYFLACQKVGKEHGPYCPRPFASLRVTCADKLLGLYGKTHFASSTLRSNTLP